MIKRKSCGKKLKKAVLLSAIPFSTEIFFASSEDKVYSAFKEENN